MNAYSYSWQQKNMTLDLCFSSVLQSNYKNWLLYCNVNWSERKYKNWNLHINVKWLKSKLYQVKKKVNKYSLPNIRLKTIEILQSSNTNRLNQCFHLQMWSTLQQLEKLDINEFNTSPQKYNKNLIKMIVLHFSWKYSKC